MSGGGGGVGSGCHLNSNNLTLKGGDIYSFDKSEGLYIYINRIPV